MARVEMYVDDTIDSSTYCSNAHIELQTQNGTSFSREGSSAMGHPGRELSDAQLAEKFRGCASGIFSESRTSKLIEMIGRIEDIDSVGLLISALSR
jgi:2-methylcitrate dehydratase PrpD